MSFLLTLLLLAPPCVQAASTQGWWSRQGRSLVVFDSSGTLSAEIGLGKWEEATATRLDVREITGGVSPDKRLAWTLERNTSWNTARTTALEKRRLLRVYGDAGRELWEEPFADAPQEGDPIIFSQDAALCLVALRGELGWTASVRSWASVPVWDTGPYPNLRSIALTPNGRYVMLSWRETDTSATHTFLEISSKKRKDIPSGTLHLGQATISAEGKVTSGKKTVFDFSAAAAKTP
ncbi:MAG: hypothetical protein AAB320_01225 [Elusimicrobiota bacterium]